MALKQFFSRYRSSRLTRQGTVLFGILSLNAAFAWFTLQTTQDLARSHHQETAADVEATLQQIRSYSQLLEQQIDHYRFLELILKTGYQTSAKTLTNPVGFIHKHRSKHATETLPEGTAAPLERIMDQAVAIFDLKTKELNNAAFKQQLSNASIQDQKRAVQALKETFYQQASGRPQGANQGFKSYAELESELLRALDHRCFPLPAPQVLRSIIATKDRLSANSLGSRQPSNSDFSQAVSAIDPRPTKLRSGCTLQQWQAHTELLKNYTNTSKSLERLQGQIQVIEGMLQRNLEHFTQLDKTVEQARQGTFGRIVEKVLPDIAIIETSYTQLSMQRKSELAKAMNQIESHSYTRQKNLTKEADQLQLFFIFCAVISCALIVFWGFLASRSIDKLVVGSRRFAGGSLAAPIPAVDTFELQLLADTLNLMARRLAENIKELERKISTNDYHFSILTKLSNGDYSKALPSEPSLAGDLERIHLINTLVDKIKSSRERDQQLVRSQAIADTTRKLAHDLRKPFSMMNAIVMILKTCKTYQEVQERLERSVPDLERAFKAVDIMIKDLLSAGKGPNMNREEVRLADILLPVIEDMALVHNRQLSLSFDFQHTRQLQVDSAKIQRVFGNIIANAMQAMPNSGRMWFKSYDFNQNFCKVTLGNSDTYINSNDLNQLFHPDFSKDKPGGTGLGLAIVKEVIDAHGGQVWCHSSPEQGTEFHLTLPLGIAQDPQAPTD